MFGFVFFFYCASKVTNLLTNLFKPRIVGRMRLGAQLSTAHMATATPTPPHTGLPGTAHMLRFSYNAVFHPRKNLHQAFSIYFTETTPKSHPLPCWGGLSRPRQTTLGLCSCCAAACAVTSPASRRARLQAKERELREGGCTQLEKKKIIVP